MPRPRTLAALVAAAAAVLASASAGTSASARIDLSSSVAIERYLVAIGVDPATAVVQRGRRNYAGPRCPGASWSCTRARVVVQLAALAGVNEAKCAPARKVGPDSCVIVQRALAGANRAACVVGSSTGGVNQTCSITQLNVIGANAAFVRQTVEQREGAAQRAAQSTTVKQVNIRGGNVLDAAQTIRQATQEAAEAGTQRQDGFQTIVVDQSATSGANSSTIDQSLMQRASAPSAEQISQMQNAEATSPNTEATVRQSSSTGQNKSMLTQEDNLDASAPAATGAVTQVQGARRGGIAGHVDQQSAGISTSTNRQTETQTLSAPKTPALSQAQYGPWDCCTTQGTNPKDQFKVMQQSTQRANPGAKQWNRGTGRCTTSGTCKVTQLLPGVPGLEKNPPLRASFIVATIVCSDGNCRRTVLTK